jgi:hypothetical protein
MNHIRAAVAVLLLPLALLTTVASSSPGEACIKEPDPLFCHDPSSLPRTPDSAEAWMSHCR